MFPRVSLSQSPINANPRKASVELAGQRNKKAQIAQSQTFITLKNQNPNQIKVAPVTAVKRSEP